MAGRAEKSVRGGGKLAEYRRKRDPARTHEPFDEGSGDGFFVVQKHAASRLHYDFRLAMGGVLVSWAIPKGPSYDTRDKRLAVHVEDHPLSYKDFEGTIPKGEYGGGSVIVWDRGPFSLREGSVARGSLKLELFGKKLRGNWALVKIKGEQNQWLLIKERDEHADPDRDVTKEEPESVISGLTVEEIGTTAGARQWNSSVLRAIEALPPGATREAPLPRSPGFMKARLEDEVPEGEEWTYEIKLDGVRALAIREDGEVRLVTRNRKEVAFRYPEVTEALEKLPGGNFIMDGELVAFDDDGRSRFELLQGRIHLGGNARIADAAQSAPVFYYAFDLPYVERYSLEDAALLDRKAVLRTWLQQASKRIRFSDHVEGRGGQFRDLACERGLEGVIAKRADSPYRDARTGDWIKVKCLNSQEFVVVGYTPPRGGRNHFGSLLLGVYDGDRLLYAGKVGTGFDEATLRDLHRELKKIESTDPPIADPPREPGVRWVEPKLVAEVRFTEWTSDGRLRHPAFAGIRKDKDPRQVVREVPGRPRPDEGDEDVAMGDSEAVKRRARKPATKKKPATKERTTAKARRSPKSAGAGVASTKESPSRPRPPQRVQITNPQKVLFPRSGITKGEVVAYYQTIAPTMLPYIEDRPLTLVRFPNGIGQGSFFQKNQPDSLPDWIPTVTIYSPEARRDVRYIVCNDADTLTYIANLGSLDLHPWASRVQALDFPDYVVWDLDPPEEGFAKAAAVVPHVREVLEEAGLRPFLKTSGGKGLHLYVALRPENDHDSVRSFAEVIARMVVDRNPRTTTLERSKRARGGKVYVDFMQNGRGKTVVAAYSVRAKEPATVSTPVTWEEFEAGFEPTDFTIRTVPDLIARRGDPWKGFWKQPASMEQALRKLVARSQGPRTSRRRASSPKR